MIRKKKNKAILFLVLFLAACGMNNPPSETLDEYAEDPEVDRAISEFYFYPSTVRMIEKVLTAGDANVLEGVRSGRVFYGTDDSLNVIARDMTQLKSELKEEGFEMLGEFRQGKERTLAFVREGGLNRYVVILVGESSLLVELEGDISMSTIQGLNKLNSDRVMELFDLPGEDKKSNSEADSSNVKEVKVTI
jgi:hypothetical protein